VSGVGPIAGGARAVLEDAAPLVWDGALGAREYGMLAVSLAFVAWILPPAHWALFGLTAVAVYWIGVAPWGRNRRLLAALAVLALFAWASHRFPRPGVPLVLWGGLGLEAFFLLRCVDWAVSKKAGESAAVARHRPGRYALFLSFLPTLFAGPVATHRDFFRCYRPRSVLPAVELRAHLTKIAWGLLKFCLVAAYLRAAAAELRTLGESGEALLGLVSPWLCLWAYVCLYLVQLYVAFSGFCDIAIGVSRLLGFHLYENFDRPLLSRSPVRWWKTMHISAYRWLMTHVFYPYWEHTQIVRKILTVFLASGLWHLAVARVVNTDAALQLLLAVTIYGAAVAALIKLAPSRLGEAVRGVAATRAGPALALSQVTLTFLFMALVHQLFWAGMTGRPLAENVRLFQALFLGA